MNDKLGYGTENTKVFVKTYKYLLQLAAAGTVN